MSATQIFGRASVGRCGAVDVWSGAHDAPARHMEWLRAQLCEQERQRAAEYRRAHSRAAFVVGRAMLRLALSEYTHMDPRELRFGEGKNGKVELRYPAGSAVQFSLAHADGLTLIALTRGSRVGIDVERLRHVPEAHEIMARFASPSERAVWRQLPPQEHEHAFFRWWTRKEAYLKATGEGLSRRLEAFDVPISAGDEAQLLSAGDLGANATTWSLVELASAPGYLATVAIEQAIAVPPLAALWGSGQEQRTR